MLRKTACQVQFPFVSAACWNLNNKKMCLQAALVEEAGWNASRLTASKAFPISGWFLQKHEERVRRKLSSVLHMMAAAPSPLANSFSSSSSGKLVAAPWLCLLAKREAGVTLLSRARWRASPDLRTDPVPVLRKLTGCTTFGFSAGSDPAFQ